MLKLVKRPGSPFWVARGTINRVRIERSTGCRKKDDARRVADDFAAEETRNAAGATGPLRFDQAVAIYLTERPAARYIAPLLRHFKTTAVSEINNAAMRKAANALYPEAAPATIRRQLYTPMKAILNLCAYDDLCAVPKLKAPSGGKSRTDFLMPDKAALILQHLSTLQGRQEAVMVTLLLGQGVRVGEAVTLVWEDVSLEARFAILRDTKNGEERRITLIDRVVAALSTIKPAAAFGPVFRRSDGQPFRPSDPAGAGGGQIRYHFAQAVEKAGLDPHRFTPHICRHTWATWFYAQTLDQIRLKDEGGWKSTQWLRYTKLGTANLAEMTRNEGWTFDTKPQPLGENRGKECQAA